MRTRTAVGVWTLALLAAVGSFSVILSTGATDGSTGRAALGVAVGLAFVIAGLVSKHRRPDSRIAWPMVVVGFTWFVPALTQSTEPVLFSIGASLSDLPWAAFAFLIFAYPSGRLDSWEAKAIVGGAAVITVTLRPLWVLFNDLREMYPEGAENAFLIDERPDLARAIERTIQAVALVLIAATITYLVRRWRAASTPLRRTLSPVYGTFAATIALLALAVASDVLFGQSVSDVVFWITLVALMTVPLSFAVGILRTRLARATVGDLLLELGEGLGGGDLRNALARALNDPTLQVGYWIPELEWYVDHQGKPLPAPGEDDGRWAKVVERHGKPVAVLIHAESVRNDPELLDAVAAAAGLALENEQRVAALAESEARHKALLEALPDLIFRMSKDGTYLAFTGNERDLIAPPSETIGRKLHEVVPKEAADSITRCIDTVISAGGVQTVEYQLRMGPLNRHFEARVVESGREEVLLIVRDISDRKRTEAQLQHLQDELRTRFDEIRRERDFVRAVIQSAPSLFCLVDSDGRVVRFNKAIEETFGVGDEDNLRGRPFWEVFIAPDERDEVRKNFLERPGENETIWMTADGEPLVVAWRVTELGEEGGETRFLISGVDITERKRQEEELRSSRARIVEAGDVERRRLERNLHDGAQQRLVSISLFPPLGRGEGRSRSGGGAQALDEGERGADACARGAPRARARHPPRDPHRPRPRAGSSGPRDAGDRAGHARGGAGGAPARTGGGGRVLRRLRGAPERRQVRAGLERDRADRTAERARPRRGGRRRRGRRRPVAGSGLRGLADRVEALDGRLEVESAPGRGTIVRAEIPVP